MTRTRNAANLVLAIGLVGCSDRLASPPNLPPTLTTVTVAPSTITLPVGEKQTLMATVIAEPRPSNSRVKWSSANPAVATVDDNGVVTAVAGGTTTIIARSFVDTLASARSVVLVPANSLGTVLVIGVNQNGKAADRTNVFGNIDVITNVQGGVAAVARVELVLTRNGVDTVVASHTPTSTASNAPTTLSFSTSGLTNGPYSLKVRVTLQNGTVILSAPLAITIKNP